MLAPLSDNFFICQMSTNLSNIEHLFQTKKHPRILILGKSMCSTTPDVEEDRVETSARHVHQQLQQHVCIIGHLHSRERNTVRHLYPNCLLKNEHPIFLFLTTKTKKKATFQRTMIRLDSVWASIHTLDHHIQFFNSFRSKRNL